MKDVPARSKLQVANQMQWQSLGQISRMIGLLKNLKFKDISPATSSICSMLIQMLEYDIVMIKGNYAELKKKELAARRQIRIARSFHPNPKKGS